MARKLLGVYLLSADNAGCDRMYIDEVKDMIACAKSLRAVVNQYLEQDFIKWEELGKVIGQMKELQTKLIAIRVPPGSVHEPSITEGKTLLGSCDRDTTKFIKAHCAEALTAAEAYLQKRVVGLEDSDDVYMRGSTDLEIRLVIFIPSLRHCRRPPTGVAIFRRAGGWSAPCHQDLLQILGWFLELVLVPTRGRREQC